MKTEFNQATGKFVKTPLFATYNSDAEKEFLWQSYVPFVPFYPLDHHPLHYITTTTHQ